MAYGTFAMHDQLPIAYAVDTLGGVQVFAVDADAAASAWSAFAAGDGVVCYASSQNVLRCGCVAGTFTPLP